MSVFKAIKVTNVLYLIGIVAIAVFNNVIHANPENSVQDRLFVVVAVLFVSTPNILAAIAVPPKLRLAKTAMVSNMACFVLFVAGLVAYEQERLAIYWGVTVAAICSINVVALIFSLAGKREFQLDEDKVVCS